MTKVPVDFYEISDKLSGLRVTLNNGKSHENLDIALKILKKKIKKTNHVLDMRKNEFYEKPSETRKNEKHKQKMRAKYQDEDE